MKHLKPAFVAFLAVFATSALAQEPVQPQNPPQPLLPPQLDLPPQIPLQDLPQLLPQIQLPVLAPPPLCAQTEWKSIDAQGNVQDGCELRPYTTTITNLSAAAGKEIALALKQVGSTTATTGQPALQQIANKSTALAKELEDSTIAIVNSEQLTVSAQIRAGFIPEADAANCKGNVIFLEGLSDSMQNHLPLFKELSSAGYRVITFDYMGQGGSRTNGEKADNIRVEDLPDLGEQIYKRYATNPACKKKILLGWSTGGLVAYYWAADRLTDSNSITSQIEESEKALKDPNQNVPSFMYKPVTDAMKWFASEIETYLPDPAKTLASMPKGPATGNQDIDAVVLMAPALAVRTLPGKIGLSDFTTVTPDIMTPDAEAQKAYVDPFFPEHVTDSPNLGADILFNSIVSRAVYYYPIPLKFHGVNLAKYMGLQLRWAAWTVPKRIKGLVLVASKHDKIVNSDALLDEFPTRSAPGMAPHFQWVSYQDFGPKKLGIPTIYPPAFHGLDNERPAIAGAVKSEILGFLNNL